MAAPQPTAPTDQPPPTLPSMPDVSDTLSNYLRAFSLWCRTGFRDKISGSSAQPGLLLQANDAPADTIPAVFLLQVKTDGTIVAIQQSLGSGKP